ncbi:MAG: hypothetical protein IAG13_12350 [Deltaproteobacteria bacterium]|nr:hypothetical protein [Nannocystaceae bacterium]
MLDGGVLELIDEALSLAKWTEHCDARDVNAGLSRPLRSVGLRSTGEFYEWLETFRSQLTKLADPRSDHAAER